MERKYLFCESCFDGFHSTTFFAFITYAFDRADRTTKLVNEVFPKTGNSMFKLCATSSTHPHYLWKRIKRWLRPEIFFLLQLPLDVRKSREMRHARGCLDIPTFWDLQVFDWNRGWKYALLCEKQQYWLLRSHLIQKWSQKTFELGSNQSTAQTKKSKRLNSANKCIISNFV